MRTTSEKRYLVNMFLYYRRAIQSLYSLIPDNKVVAADLALFCSVICVVSYTTQYVLKSVTVIFRGKTFSQGCLNIK